MESTKLSSKGQVIIPKHIRSSYHWEAGQELIVIDTGDGILLKPKAPFLKSTLNAVAGCLNYKGTAKTIDDMNAAVANSQHCKKLYTFDKKMITQAKHLEGSKVLAPDL